MSASSTMRYSPDGTGVFTPDVPVAHLDEQYDSRNFDLLLAMQSRHFWYLGRHRFLLRALQRQLRARSVRENGPTAIDFGGGCGGWITYLQEHMPGRFSELALSDSSLCALEAAASVVGDDVGRYQVDLLRLGWRNRWDVAFLLDVLEHIPDDVSALAQIKEALEPGGLLFVTTPALRIFWSYNDEVAHHVRRYSKSDFVRLAESAGLELLDARYFMFFLSPLMWLSRRGVKDKNPSEADLRAAMQRAHQVPSAPVNALLHAVFSLETPLGHWLPFPWGTSVLGIFRKA